MGDWNIPGDLKYTENDEWVKLEGDEALIGITDYAQDQLSDLVFVELPEVDEAFEQGDPFAVVESVKAASDVYMPVGGTVVSINEQLEDAPEIINEDPYDNGWIIRIQVADSSQMDDLLDADAYVSYCEERA